MKIHELRLRNFGKFQNQTIRLGDGINIIYGENESGKSTIYSFVRGMLFGLERGRGRASIYDTYSIYEPWENPNYYSGVLRFESGGKHFRIDRNFDKYTKKAELVCEDDGEELSVRDGDLEMLLGGMSASDYENTLLIGQMRVQPDKTLAASLREYANEYYASGNGELRTEQALLLLREQKKESDRAASLVLEQKQQERERIEQEAAYIWRDLHRLEEEQEQVQEKIRKKESMRQQQNPDEKQGIFDSLRPSKWRIHPLEILMLAAVFVLALTLLDKPINFFAAIVVFLAGGLYIWNRMKVSKKNRVSEEQDVENSLSEPERSSLERLKGERDRIEAERKEKEIQYSNLREQQEELDEAGEEYKRQERKSRAIQMAMERIQELSSDYRNRLEQELNQAASEILSEITGGRYDHLIVEDHLHMSLFKDGKRIAVEQVSRGTAEQIYFALRMAAASILLEEEQPVILDDSFGNYDDRRLKQVLRWLHHQGRQIVILTCQHREESLLKELHIPHQYIEL